MNKSRFAPFFSCISFAKVACSFCCVAAVSQLAACSNPQPGPDKTVGGILLGAGWGAGAGAVIGNQVATSGGGVAVGAGLGAIQGGLTGGGFDVAEGAILDQERTLASLKVETLANSRELDSMQEKLDHAIATEAQSGIYQVFFDADATSLRSGAVANLEVLAESIKQNPGASKIFVAGHADDAGTPEYNQRLSEARARTVSAYLSARGISIDQISVSSYGSTRPLTTNATPEGRQLNRRVDVYLGR